MSEENEAYQFYKSHKVEDNIANEMYDLVFDHICQWFGVEELVDITTEQMDEIIDFRENQLNEYSPLQWGYSSVIGNWENETWEREQND